MHLISQNKAIAVTLILAAVIMLSCLIGGCSVIGLATGAALDKDHPDKKEYRISETELIEPGREISVVLKTKETITGKYKRSTQLCDEEYGAIFGRFWDESTSVTGIPAPGDTMKVVNMVGRQGTFELIGYNYDYLRVKSIGETEPIALLIRNIDNITVRDKNTVSVEELKTMIAENRIPVFRVMILNIDGDTAAFPTSAVDRVFSIDKKNRIWKGLAIGFAIDLALAIWFITQLPLDIGLR
jgi:hypothetical protein